MSVQLDAQQLDAQYVETARRLLACDVSLDTITKLLRDLYDDGADSAPLREAAEPAQ